MYSMHTLSPQYSSTPATHGLMACRLSKSMLYSWEMSEAKSPHNWRMYGTSTADRCLLPEPTRNLGNTTAPQVQSEDGQYKWRMYGTKYGRRVCTTGTCQQASISKSTGIVYGVHRQSVGTAKRPSQEYNTKVLEPRHLRDR